MSVLANLNSMTQYPPHSHIAKIRVEDYRKATR